MDELIGKITIVSKTKTPNDLINFCDCIECDNIINCYDEVISKEIPLSIITCEGYKDEDELDSIYLIAKELFEDIYLEYSLLNEDTISDWYQEEKIIYKDNKKLKTINEYCYGNYTSNNKNVWVLLKEEIEEKAKIKNININWNGEENLDSNSSNLYPATEEFYDLCNEVLDEKGGLKEISKIIIDEKPIKDLKLLPEIFQMILENSQISEYTNIEDKLETKYKEIIDNIYIYKNFNKEELLNYIKKNKVVNFKYINKELQDDKEVVLANLKRKVFVNFKYVSERLKDDKTVINAAIKCNPSYIKYASERIKLFFNK